MASHFHFLGRGIDTVFMWRKAPTVLTPNAVRDNTAINVLSKHNLRAGRNQTTVTVHVASNLRSLGPRKRALSSKSYFPLARENSVLSSRLPWLWLTKLSQTILYNTFCPPYHFSTAIQSPWIWCQYSPRDGQNIVNNCRIQTETQKKTIILWMSAVKSWELYFVTL
jgi:hypothetical protein